METTTIVLIAGGALAVFGLAFWFLRPREPKAVEHLHFNCTGCKRRLRYLPRQAGHAGACPRCGKAVMFPKE